MALRTASCCWRLRDLQVNLAHRWMHFSLALGVAMLTVVVVEVAVVVGLCVRVVRASDCACIGLCGGAELISRSRKKPTNDAGVWGSVSRKVFLTTM
jgi:hypothetical protein